MGSALQNSLPLLLAALSGYAAVTAGLNLAAPGPRADAVLEIPGIDTHPKAAARLDRRHPTAGAVFDSAGNFLGNASALEAEIDRITLAPPSESEDRHSGMSEASKLELRFILGGLAARSDPETRERLSKLYLALADADLPKALSRLFKFAEG